MGPPYDFALAPFSLDPSLPINHCEIVCCYLNILLEYKKIYSPKFFFLKIFKSVPTPNPVFKKNFKSESAPDPRKIAGYPLRAQL